MEEIYHKSQAILGDNMDYMRTIPDGYFDFSVVDPPYGINAPNMNMGQNKKRSITESTANRLRKESELSLEAYWDKGIPDTKYFSELFRISKNQIICGYNYFPLNPSRGIVCWDKKNNWEAFSQIELIWTSLDFPAKIYRESTRGGDNKEKKIHPTQKPVGLYLFLYRVCGLKAGMKVIDTHLGSGSSRIAAEKYNLDFTGVENNPEYYITQEKRYEEYLKYRQQLPMNFKGI